MSHMIYVHKTTTLVTGFIIDGEEKIGFFGVHIHLRWSGFLLEVEEKNPEPGGGSAHIWGGVFLSMARKK